MCKEDQVKKLLGDPVECDIPAARAFEILQQKVHMHSCLLKWLDA